METMLPLLAVLKYFIEHPWIFVLLFVLLVVISASIKHKNKKAREQYYAMAEQRQREEERRRKERMESYERYKWQQKIEREKEEAQRKEKERIERLERRKEEKEKIRALVEKEKARDARQAFIAEQRRLVTDKMRYDVLQRDGCRCVICGASAKDGVVLHVDHIVPLAKGGLSEMSNLRTLCERCNMGKGARLETPIQNNQKPPNESEYPCIQTDNHDEENRKETKQQHSETAVDEVRIPLIYFSIDELKNTLRENNFVYDDLTGCGGNLWIESSDKNDPALSSVRVSGRPLRRAESTKIFNGNPGWYIK